MRNRETQRQRVLRVLQEANGRPVPGYVLAEAGGLQWQARVWELRHTEGYDIRCDVKHVNGQVHSTYRLVPASRLESLFTEDGMKSERPREQSLEVRPWRL